MRFAPAAARNAAAILERLRGELRDGERVLELGAGTGQHACAFARALPGIDWLPSEHPACLDDLRERVAAEGSPNLRPPHPLDILDLPWTLPSPIDVCYAANVLHMLSEHGGECVLRGAAAILPAGGRLILYGPFAIDGEHTGPGNRAFDAALRADGTGRGVRDLSRLDELAHACGFGPSRRITMPSDNRLVVWERYENATSQAFAGRNKSAILTDLMREAIVDAERQKRRAGAAREILNERDESPRSMPDQMRRPLDLSIPVRDDALVLARAMALSNELGHHLFDTLYHAPALEEEGTLVTADARYRSKARDRGGIVALPLWRDA